MKTIQTLHAVVLALLFCFGLVSGLTTEPRVWLLWSVYLFLFLGTTVDEIWCYRLAIIPPLALFLWTAPFVATNCAAFLAAAPTYQDSPATIIIVGITAAFTTLPAAVTLGAYWNHRKAVFGRS